MNPWRFGRGFGKILALLAVVSGVGCGDGGPKSGSSIKERNPATAPLDYLAVQGQAKKHSEGVASLAQVQQALQQFRATEDRWPEDLQELVRSGLLARLPPMPAGQRMDYDAKTGVARLAR